MDTIGAALVEPMDAVALGADRELEEDAAAETDVCSRRQRLGISIQISRVLTLLGDKTSVALEAARATSAELLDAA